MKISINVTSNVDTKEWNKDLSKSIESTTYQTSQFAQVYYDAYGSEPVYVIAQDSKGKIIGQLLALFHKKYYWRNTNLITKKIFSHFDFNSCLWNYGPIIHDKNNEYNIILEMFTALEKYALRKKTMMLHGSTSPLYNINNHYFNENKYSSMSWKTYVIDLNLSKDSLYAKLNKKIKYDIRKSQDNNLEFIVNDDLESLNAYTQLSIDSPARKKENRKFDQKFVDSYFNNLMREGLSKIATVKFNDDLIGGILLLNFNKMAVQMGVENSAKKKLLGGPFLTWNTISWLSDNKFNYFDLGGANPNPKNTKEKQIDFYKSKWLGKELFFKRFTKIINPKKYKIFSSLTNPSRAFQKIINRY